MKIRGCTDNAAILSDKRPLARALITVTVERCNYVFWTNCRCGRAVDLAVAAVAA